MADIYLGLMSGTSLDAVDAVAVLFDGQHCQLLATHSLDLPLSLRADILTLTQPSPYEIDLMGKVDVEIALLFAQCANELCTKLTSEQQQQIKAIGSHGQTIRHRPYEQTPFTLQIGDPNVIAEKTGMTVVADFRRRDVAACGQGAPLVPAFHKALLRNSSINRVVLNLGGMANITVLPSQQNALVYGYDTGPANVLMDAWCQHILQQNFDDNGRWAASGTVDSLLLNDMLAHPFFTKAAPKSTGREDFHLDWLLEFFDLKHSNVLAEDVQATLLELTATSVANEINKIGFTQGELYVCGGGAYNQYLWQSLAKKLPNYQLLSTESIGISPTWIEATAFAWLAQQTINGLTGNLPAVTGADGKRILGGIFQA